MIQIFPGGIFMIEVFLIGLVVAIIGAGGFVFFIYSMHADRNARLRKLADHNPWDHMMPEKESEIPKRFRPSKGFIIWLIALIISVSALVLFIILTKNLNVIVE